VVPRVARLIGAAALSTAAVLVPAGLASAEDPPVSVQIAGTAYLQSDGSALLTFTYNCFPGLGGPQNGSYSATLEQSQALGLAGGTLTCDDRNHTITVDMPPGPFTRAEAAAHVSVASGANDNADAQAEVTIR
jgi:hypothetical protein